MSDPWLVQKDSEQSTNTDNLSNGHCTENGHSAATTPPESAAISGTALQFEDNFEPGAAAAQNNSTFQPLPDSEQYLKCLENKLRKLKKSPKLLEALAQAKEASLRNLLNQSHNDSALGLLCLDNSLIDTNTSVSEFYRQIQPIQPVTSGETVQLVHYDQLELSLREEEASLSSLNTSEESAEPVRQPFKRINH